MNKRVMVLMWGAAVLVTGVLTLGNLFLGELNQDEGWYLYAARLVSEGELPYVDFASTQGPVMPFVYSLAQPLVARWGVLGGRLFTLFLGALSLVSCSWFAARLAPAGKRSAAALLAFVFVGVNVYQAYFFTIVKTYALAALLLTLGFVCLTYTRGRRGGACGFLSGALLTLAGATRLSAGFSVPIVFLVLLHGAVTDHRRRRRDDSTLPPSQSPHTPILPYSHTPTLLFFALGSVVTAAAVFGPFLLTAPEGLRFALMDYHAGRTPGSPFALLAYKAGFVLRVVRAYLVPLSVAVVLCLREVLVTATREGGQGGDRRTFAVAAWLAVLGISVLHFAAPFPYDDYQVIVFPLFSAALSSAIVRRMASREPSGAASRRPAWLLVSVLVLCGATAFSAPRVQGWFVAGQDRMWWPLKTEFPLQRLARAADRVASVAGPDGLLLTQDPYLAVESGLRVPRGMELGPFCYFPELDRNRAERLHVLNRQMMVETLQSCGARVAAFSGYGLAIRAPSITQLPRDEQRALWQVLEGRYDLVEDIENFGQAGTTLRVLQRRGRQPLKKRE